MKMAFSSIWIFQSQSLVKGYVKMAHSLVWAHYKLNFFKDYSLQKKIKIKSPIIPLPKPPNIIWSVLL